MNREKVLNRSFSVFFTRIPVFSAYAKTRGWPYVIAWCHRGAGLFLVAFVWFHIYTLLSLSSPSLYDARMIIYGFFPLTILEWALGIPVIFHALNGGRLILYESLEMRNDESMIRWLLGLSILYIGLLGIIMLIGTQSVSPVFFWLLALAASVTLAYGAISKIWAVRHSLSWRLQRVTGAFLLVMVPAHFLFMHLNPTIAKEASVVITRMQHPFIKAVDLALLVGILYHSGHGLVSVVRDYFSSRVLHVSLVALVSLVMLGFAWIGMSLILSI